MRKTIKISFEEDDPRYVFISEYGKRFDSRTGSSVVVQMMIDEVLKTAAPFSSLSSRMKMESPVLDAGKELPPPPPGPQGKQRETDLLSAFEDFQSKL